MTELLFFLACILIYLYSFLYRTISTIAIAVLMYIAYLTHTNLLYVGGMILILGIIRMNKHGIKDEY